MRVRVRVDRFLAYLNEVTVSSSRLRVRSEAKESVQASTAASACGTRPLIRCVIAGGLSLARPRLWTIGSNAGRCSFGPTASTPLVLGTQTPSARALGSVICRALGL